MSNSKPIEWRFSLFYNPNKGLNNCTPIDSINLERLMEVYHSPYLKKKSTELKTANQEERNKIKRELPYFTPTGVYSYRNNAGIIQYNSSMLPLDIDNLEEEEAEKLQFHLSNQQGCILSVVSPRGRGVKALFYLGCDIEMDNYYKTLESNLNTIAKNLNIEEFERHIDVAQFKLCQPFFIGYNPLIYCNERATSTRWKIENVAKKIIEYNPPTITKRIPSTLIEERRMYAYFDKLCTKEEELFSSLSYGSRHSNIWRVGGLSSYLHYAPQFTNEIKTRLFNAVRGMYKSEEEFKESRAQKTFEGIWNNQQPRTNKILQMIIEESIIEEYKIKQQ